MFDLDFYEGKYFKVNKVSKVEKLVPTLEFKTLPIKYGLAIEFKKQKGGSCVVAFIKWDWKKEGCVYDDVDFRTVKCLNPKNLKEFKKAVEQAQELVAKANGYVTL